MGPRDLNTPGLTGHMAKVIARSEAKRRQGAPAKRQNKSAAPKRKGGLARKKDD